MTETSILPISSSNAQPPNGDQDGSDEGSAAGPNRRKLFIVGGVAGAAVVIVAAFMLLHGGSSPSTATAGAVPHGTFKAPPSAPAHSGTKTVTLPKKSKVQAGRNPFTALYVAPVTAGTAVGGTTTVGSSPSPGPTAPVAGPTPIPTPTSPPVGPLGAPTYVQLLSTKGTRSATFQVGYAHHKFKKFNVFAPSAGASTGTVFATEFALISIKGGVAMVQIGDGPPFPLNAGVARQV
jgi:hypothetical protein